MKYLIKVILLFCLFITACSEVYFKQPQPPGKKDLISLPAKTHGLYITTEGDSALSIFNDHILYYMDDDKDLKFSMNENMVVRKYKGDYYINIKDEEKPFWMVFLFSFRKNELLLKYSDPKEEELEKFKKITRIEEESSNTMLEYSEYLLDPSLKELKELVKEGFFEVMDTLVRVK